MTILGRWTASVRFMLIAVVVGMAFVQTSCTPSAEMNVLGYLISDQLGTLQPADPYGPTGSLTGLVLDGKKPIAGANVVVAERTGRPHAGQTDEVGRYRIDGIPVGQYVPAAIAPGYDERAAADVWGVPKLVDVTDGGITEAPPLLLAAHVALPSVDNLGDAVGIARSRAYTATAAFPEGASAQVEAYQFERQGAVIDTLRVYRPVGWAPGEPIPLLFFVYPGDVDAWESVSAAYASEGYGVVAISPVAEWGMEIDAHAHDAFLALQLARSGELGLTLTDEPAVALGGSFSSAILNRLMRDIDGEIGAWVTVGGIGDAFDGAHDFYTGAIHPPAQYELLIPALGNPKLYPLPFLRLSPVYSAAQLPFTLIIHTASDQVIPIAQAAALAAAINDVGVPVETYFYDDVSHYLQIDENMTPEAKGMYYHILDYIARN